MNNSNIHRPTLWTAVNLFETKTACPRLSLLQRKEYGLAYLEVYLVVGLNLTFPYSLYKRTIPHASFRHKTSSPKLNSSGAFHCSFVVHHSSLQHYVLPVWFDKDLTRSYSEQTANKTLWIEPVVRRSGLFSLKFFVCCSPFQRGMSQAFF